MVNKYYVWTPEYDSSPSNSPPEWGCDIVEVEADTRRKALVLGLKKLDSIHSEWITDERGDGRNPFSTLKIQRACECIPPGSNEAHCTGDCYPEDES